jgi:hypothetical protein
MSRASDELPSPKKFCLAASLETESKVYQIHATADRTSCIDELAPSAEVVFSNSA